MNADTLCTLLAQRIPPEQFQVHGLEVVYFDPDKNNKPVGSPNESPYDTPENRAIVADVIKNYDMLAGDMEKAAQEATDVETLISAMMLEMHREQAITALVAEGKLTVEGKVAR